MNKKHNFKYLNVEEEFNSENYQIWVIKKKSGGIIADFYDLDLALQTAYFLDNMFYDLQSGQPDK